MARFSDGPCDTHDQPFTHPDTGEYMEGTDLLSQVDRIEEMEQLEPNLMLSAT